MKKCPFKFKGIITDESRMEIREVHFEGWTSPDGFKNPAFTRYDVYVDGEPISFGEEYKIPTKDAFLCDIRSNKECVSEKKCPIANPRGWNK